MQVESNATLTYPEAGQVISSKIYKISPAGGTAPGSEVHTAQNHPLRYDIISTFKSSPIWFQLFLMVKIFVGSTSGKTTSIINLNENQYSE